MRSPLLLTTARLLASLLAPIAGAAELNVYFGSTGDGGIHHAVFDNNNGTLSPPQKVAELSGAGFIAVHPTQDFLYSTTSAATRGAMGVVTALRINADKSLTLINQQSSEGHNPCHVSLDTTGQALLVANYSSRQSVAALKINPDGSLAPSQSTHLHAGSGEHPNRQREPHPHSIIPHPSNTHAYASDLGTDRVMMYKLDPTTAKLTPVTGIKIPGGSKGPRHMKISADTHYAYVLNELSMEISVFGIDPTTSILTYLETISTLADRSDIKGISCSEIRIHPNGKFVYAANRDTSKQGRDSISIFYRSQFRGRLRRIAVVPAEVSIPRNFNIDPSGRWMLVGGQDSNDIAIFEIDPSTGALTHQPANIPFDGSPICIEFVNR